MIETWQDCRRYIAADLSRYRGSRAKTLLMQPQVRWLVRLRLTEWWCNALGGPVGFLLRWRLAAVGARWGYSISINRVGPGLRLPHVGTIAINGSAHVGANCQILPDVVLGGNDSGAPTVGRDVFIGPGVKIIGPVVIGDGAVLTAGAVVLSDVPSGAKFGGVPATLLRSSPGASTPDGDMG